MIRTNIQLFFVILSDWINRLTGEDDWFGGTASVVQQLDALEAVPAQGPQVAGEHAEDGVPLRHLYPEQQPLPHPGAGHLLLRPGARDPDTQHGYCLWL